MLRSPYRNAVIFYAIALGLAIGLVLLEPVLGELSLILYATTPAIAVAVMLFVLARDDPAKGKAAALGLSRSGLRGWPMAAAVPFGIHAAGLLMLVAAGLSVFAFDALHAAPVDFVMNFVINALFGLVLAFTEELGWRGYMLPRLMRLGMVRALLLVGFLHGVWHLPLILGTGFYHADGAMILVVPLFLIALTLAGVFYGVLRLWTGSVWPVVIAHAMINTSWNLVALLSHPKSVMATEYIGGESGLLVIAGLVVVDLWLLRAIRRGKIVLQPV